MKAIKIGSRVEIYGDTITTYSKLPAKTYIIKFDKLSGFYLDEYADIAVNEDKVYGEHIQKVGKVLRSYGQFDRNLGVILSGSKGIGKSMFAKLLSVEALKNDIRKLSDFIVNRPGRFHYHFRFEYPAAEEIRTYLHDKLDSSCSCGNAGCS